jgi:hypothetical protein
MGAKISRRPRVRPRMSIVFVHGGNAFARLLFRSERRAYWAQALPVVLEKYGYLDVEEAPPEELETRLTPGDGEQIVLVARLPAALWTDDLVDRLVTGPTPALVEGPLPRPLRERLGIRAQRARIDDGLLTVTDPEIRALGSETVGSTPGGPISRPVYRRVARLPELDWSARGDVPITVEQAAAWRAPAWDVEPWDVPGRTRVLAEWTPWAAPADRCPAIARFGSLIVCSFSLFDFLAQAHTSEPADGGEHRASRRVTGIEALLLGAIDAMHQWAGIPRARILPWPTGIDWVRSVRHDFDRPMTAEEVADVLRRHRERGTAATWYWRAQPRLGVERGPQSQADLSAARLVAAAPEQEVALHTEVMWGDADDERAPVEAAIGGAVMGSTAHGGVNCFRFQGAPNVLWAAQQGLLYTELAQHAHVHPHRFPQLLADGSVEIARILCLPVHASFDLSTRPGAVNIAALRSALPTWRRLGAFVQIMNHPDIHVDELFAFLTEMPDDGRADWTAARACDWWLRTHVAGEITLRMRTRGLQIASRRPAQGVCVEILHPDGSRERRSVDVESS